MFNLFSKDENIYNGPNIITDFSEDYSYEDYIEEHYQILKDTVPDHIANPEYIKEILESLKEMIPFIKDLRDKFFCKHKKYPFINFYAINKIPDEHDLSVFFNGCEELVIVRYCREDVNTIKGPKIVYNEFMEMVNKVFDKLESNQVLPKYGSLSTEGLPLRGLIKYTLNENAYVYPEPDDDDKQDDIDPDSTSDGTPEPEDIIDEGGGNNG